MFKISKKMKEYAHPTFSGRIVFDANHPSVLYCPYDRTSKEQYESTSYAYSMAFYHSPEQIDKMTGPADTYSNPQLVAHAEQP